MVYFVFEMMYMSVSVPLKTNLVSWLANQGKTSTPKTLVPWNISQERECHCFCWSLATRTGRDFSGFLRGLFGRKPEWQKHWARHYTTLRAAQCTHLVVWWRHLLHTIVREALMRNTIVSQEGTQGVLEAFTGLHTKLPAQRVPHQHPYLHSLPFAKMLSSTRSSNSSAPIVMMCCYLSAESAQRTLREHFICDCICVVPALVLYLYLCCTCIWILPLYDPSRFHTCMYLYLCLYL